MSSWQAPHGQLVVPAAKTLSKETGSKTETYSENVPIVVNKKFLAEKDLQKNHDQLIPHPQPMTQL